jgi:hypothetical protein
MLICVKGSLSLSFEITQKSQEMQVVTVHIVETQNFALREAMLPSVVSELSVLSELSVFALVDESHPGGPCISRQLTKILRKRLLKINYSPSIS